jgi:glycosyltransferase involved in cell wall biosynthesis
VKLLVDATALQSEHRLRGVGMYLRQLILATERLGDVQPWYLVSTVGLEHVAALPQERLVKVYRPHRPAQVYWSYNELALRTALLRLRPDVFFAPDFNGLVRNPFGRAVATLHDLTALKLAGPAPSDLSGYLSDLRWRAYYRKLARADHVIAISRAVARDATELLGIPSERITLIHHGIDHELLRPRRGKGAYAGQGRYIVHIGGRNENKNQARILEAFAHVAREHPDVQLYFAGPWRPVDIAWLEAKRERLGVGARARHLGYVPDEVMPSLYSNAAVFLFPSLEEGFGFPILEAMACGVPVITSDRSALLEVAGDAALLIDPYSVPSLGAALARVLSDAALQRSLSARGLERAREFTWEATARATLRTLLHAGR